MNKFTWDIVEKYDNVCRKRTFIKKLGSCPPEISVPNVHSWFCGKCQYTQAYQTGRTGCVVN